MKRQVLVGAVAALAISLGATEVRAAIILDFANGGVYGGANGLTNFPTTDQGVGVNLSSTGGTLRQTGEGLGVNGPSSLDDPGEVGIIELLTIGFTSPQFVLSVALEQLFINDPFPGLNEQGQYSINSAAFVPFVAVNSTGFLTLNIASAGVNSLQFRVPTSLKTLADDYSVRSVSLDQTTVPEPATLILVGGGLAGAFVQRRRKKAQGV